MRASAIFPAPKNPIFFPDSILTSRIGSLYIGRGSCKSSTFGVRGILALLSPGTYFIFRELFGSLGIRHG